MTPADRNELIDRAARIAGLPTLEYMIERAILEEHLISRVSIADLTAIRDMPRPTIGARMITDIVDGWNFA